MGIRGLVTTNSFLLFFSSPFSFCSFLLSSPFLPPTDPKLPILLKMLRWGQDELEAKVTFPRINNLTTAAFAEAPSNT